MTKWRKTYDKKHRTSFAKPFTYDRVTIYRIEFFKNKPYYQVIIQYQEDKSPTSKRFKTKSQALKYARTYMRKN